MIKVCCVCGKIEQEGHWLNSHDAHLSRVSHVYCPLCFEDFMDEIDRYALQQCSKSVYTIIEAGQPQGV